MTFLRPVSITRDAKRSLSPQELQIPGPLDVWIDSPKLLRPPTLFSLTARIVASSRAARTTLHPSKPHEPHPSPATPRRFCSLFSLSAFSMAQKLGSQDHPIATLDVLRDRPSARYW